MHTTREYIRLGSRFSSRFVAVARIGRVLDYLFGVLYALLSVRLLLEFLHARKASGFFGAIRSVTDPFYAPFAHIVPSSSVEGAPIVWPLVVAILGYMLLHAAIRGLLRLVARG